MYIIHFKHYTKGKLIMSWVSSDYFKSHRQAMKFLLNHEEGKHFIRDTDLSWCDEYVSYDNDTIIRATIEKIKEFKEPYTVEQVKNTKRM